MKIEEIIKNERSNSEKDSREIKTKLEELVKLIFQEPKYTIKAE